MKSGCWNAWLVVAGCVEILFFSHRAIAQLNLTPDTAPDRALGTIVVPFNAQIDLITGGTRPGNGINLFHSFQEFNVREGRSVYFANPAGVQNIFSRVTGGTRSQILGKLGVINNANLFLINPNGIIFGRNAVLDVGGSFVATTADAVRFGDQGNFNASNPEAPSLLTVNPSALLFNQLAAPSSRAIENRGFLRVPDGQNLLLVGGDIRLDQGILAAFGGRVELGGLENVGNIGLDFSSGKPQMQFPEASTRANVSLANRSIVDVSAGDSGNVAVYAQNLELSANSGILAGIDGGFGSVDSQAGNITLNIVDTTRILSGSFIENDVNSNEIGNAGNVNITTGSLFLSDRAYISASTFGQGKTGDIVINARDLISLDNNAIILSRIGQNGVGQGGDLQISADTLELTGGSQVSSTISGGRGFAGNIFIKAQAVTINGKKNSFFSQSGIVSGVGFNSIGKSGDIEIETTTLQLFNSAVLSAQVTGVGIGGNIRVRAKSITLSGQNPDAFEGSQITTNLGVSGRITGGGSEIPFGIGRAGSIDIQAESLTLRDNASITALTDGNGNAGNVQIRARKIDLDDRSSIFASATGFGNAGDINILTESLSLKGGAQLLAFTEGKGTAGNIQIIASDSVELVGSSSTQGTPSALFTDNETISPGGSGNINVTTNRFRIANGAIVDARTRNQDVGGDITINANVFEALNGGQLISTSQGSGKAGTITVNATQQFLIDGSDSSYASRSAKFGRNRIGVVEAASGLFVRSQASGSSGNIVVNAPTIQLSNGGKLNAESFSGDGGNIRIQSSKLLLLRHSSSISTNAGTAQQGGNGGNITINMPNGFLVAVPQENSDITANAFQGSGGNIRITARGIFGTQFRPQLTPESDITASSTFGVSGTVAIASPDTSTLQNALTQLPKNPIDTSALLSNSCIVRRTQQSSSFTITGSGGLPVRPDDASVSAYPTGEVQLINEDAGTRRHEDAKTPDLIQNSEFRIQNSQPRPWKIGDPIVEPTGVYQLETGQLVMSRECENYTR
jgi:filamentous hemagglutinin family protein